jgi:hypothetical protein
MNQFSCVVYTSRFHSVLTSEMWQKRYFVLLESNAITYHASITSIAFTSGVKHIIHIDDLNSDKYYLKEPIEVTITDLGDQILAEFVEAEISVSEDTASEALSWLKSRIVGSYVRFKNQLDKLGPVPIRQLQVLEEYVGEEQSA